MEERTKIHVGVAMMSSLNWFSGGRARKFIPGSPF